MNKFGITLDYEISSLITGLIITCANSIKITNCNGVCLLSCPIHPYTPWLLLSCRVGPSLSSIFWERGLVLMVSCCFFCCREQEQKVHDIRSNVKDVIVVSSVQSSGTVHSFMDDGSICMMSFYCSALMPLTPHLPTSSLLTPHFSPPSSLIPLLHSSPPTSHPLHPSSHPFTPHPLTTTYRQWHRKCLVWFLPYPWATVRIKTDYDTSRRRLWDLTLSSHK